MASTYTSNSGLELITTGEKAGLWGDTTNTNIQIIDRMTNGVGTITLSGTTHTLNTVDGSLSDGHYAVLVFAGSPSGTNTVTISPSDQQKTFVVKNTTDQTVVLTQGSGGNVTLSAGKSAIVYANGGGAGAAVVNVTDSSTLQFGLNSSSLIWVSVDGDDTNDGFQPYTPVRTLKHALSLVAQGGIVSVGPGTFSEVCPMVVPRDVSIIGAGLRVTQIEPTLATNTNSMFLVDSGAYLTGMTFAGHQAGAWAVRFNASADNTSIGAADAGAYIFKSPYIQNCTSYTAQDDSGVAGSTSDGTTGGGMLVDGDECASNSPIRSMVVDSYTQINLDGPGALVTNNAYAQLVSFFGTFCSYHVKASNGGQVNLSNSTTDFGTQGLVADGKSATAIYTGTASAQSAGENNFVVTALTPNTVGSSNRPAQGQVFVVGGNTYTITGAAPATGGYTVTFYPVLSGALSGGETVSFYQRSQISSSGHTMEYVGAGTNYNALPFNGGEPIPANEVVELNGGRVFYSTTDQLGNFRVGTQFSVNGTTGEVTINTDSFNISGLNAIGPFSRDGGQTSVGVQLQEVSNNTDLNASTGVADGNTAPTQYAVKTYLTNNYTLTSSLAAVATSGSYTDLINKPTLYDDAAVDTHLNTSTATTGQVLSWTGTDYDWISDEGGTVTSVAATVPTGFSISGSPITASGTLAITYSAGYQGYTTAEASKLSGIEAGADVTDATNVTAAGALMDSELTSEASVKALDQGVATTDSPSFAGFTSTANASFDATKQLTFTGRSDGSGSIDQLIKLSAGDVYGRPAVSYYDASARHRVSAAFHEQDGTSGSPGSLHDAYEIKTSADPAGGTPSNMFTRFSIGTDADLATVTFNTVDRLDVRDGTATQFSVDTTTGSVTLGDGTNEDVTIDLAGSRSAFGYDLSGGNAVVQSGLSKGISFCVNNATFASGEVWSIASDGKLYANDSLTGVVAYFGLDNVAREFGVSGTRSLFGYDGSAAYIEGGGGKGVKLRVNGATDAVTIDSAGDVTTTGTINGRNISVDGTKLDGIETGADVTDAANVDPLVDAHLNTSTATTGQVLSWTGADYDWVDGVASSAAYTKTSFTATASQTTFSVSYTVGYVDVYLNGSKLGTADYTASNGTSVVLGTGATVGDLVEIIAWSITGVGDYVPTSGGTFTGDVAFGGAIDETVYALSGTSVALDPSNGTIQTHTLTGNTTYSDSVSEGESITLMIDDGTAYTVTWPTITWLNNGGSAPTLATTGYTAIQVWKVSTTLYGALIADGT